MSFSVSYALYNNFYDTTSKAPLTEADEPGHTWSQGEKKEGSEKADREKGGKAGQEKGRDIEEEMQTAKANCNFSWTCEERECAHYMMHSIKSTLFATFLDLERGKNCDTKTKLHVHNKVAKFIQSICSPSASMIF